MCFWRDAEGADLHVCESVSRSPCESCEEMGHDWSTGDDLQLIRAHFLERRSGAKRDSGARGADPRLNQTGHMARPSETRELVRGGNLLLPADERAAKRPGLDRVVGVLVGVSRPGRPLEATNFSYGRGTQ